MLFICKSIKFDSDSKQKNATLELNIDKTKNHVIYNMALNLCVYNIN